MAAQRPQSLMAELERLEQQITLTMQEIDANFAKAHTIVTSQIIPIVERYGKESEKVWDGSKFWKQFFEASANVALSNYQEDDMVYGSDDQAERSAAGGDAETSGAGDFTSTFHSHPESPTAHEDRSSDINLLDDSLLNSPSIGPAITTPMRGNGEQPDWADLESPIEAQQPKRKARANSDSPEMEAPTTQFFKDSEIAPPSTPPTKRGNLFETPGKRVLFATPGTARTPGLKEDPLMHRALDKNWRLQATPLGKASSKYRKAATPTATQNRPYDDTDDSPMQPPDLQTMVFTPHGFKIKTPRRPAGPKTPATSGKAAMMAEQEEEEEQGGFGYYDSDEDSLMLPPGFSPPKTMQFSLPPSKLLATPAREASRRIVEDILQTAGASMSVDDSSMMGGHESPEKMDEDPF